MNEALLLQGETKGRTDAEQGPYWSIMTSTMTAQIANTIGLVVGIIGVIFIFIWGPPQPVLETGLTYNRPLESMIDDSGKTVADHNREVENRRTRHKILSRLGLAFVGLGFLFQLWATWIDC